MKQTEVDVVSRRTLCQAVWQVEVSTPQGVIDFQPGQFFLAAGPAYFRRPIWPCRMGDTGFEFLAAPGASTFDAWLSSRAPGDRLNILGPIGNGFPRPQKGEHWLLVAETATAAGPLLPLLLEAVQVNAEIVLITGASMADRLFPRNQLPPAVELQVATLDGSHGARGRVIDLVPAFLSWSDHIAAVGSITLYRSLKTVTASTPGTGRKTWALLWETPFVCGVGVCHTCAVSGVKGEPLACREGPVFHLADLSLDIPGIGVESVDD